MTELEKLQYEFDELAYMYEMARTLCNNEKDPVKRKEYRKHIFRCYDLLIAKKDRLAQQKKNAKTSQPVITTPEQKKSIDKKYYYVNIKHPFLGRNSIKNLAVFDYQNYDIMKDIHATTRTRKEKGMFGIYYDQTYTYMEPFPIIVEKAGSKITEVFTGYELMEYPRYSTNTGQIRYKDRIYYMDEKYITDRIVVELVQEVPAMVVADQIKKLSDYEINEYKRKMREIKTQIMEANRDYFIEKRKYQERYGSDEDIIAGARKR